MYLVVIGWIYVAFMMAVAEATSNTGTVVGAILTFLLYGVGPVSLVMYLLNTPARRKKIRRREMEELAKRAKADLGEPDGSGETSTDTVAPVRKEP